MVKCIKTSVLSQFFSAPRLSFIDKEKDAENGLGDFGVRKYDDDLGRFLSCDALWEKYRSLTPYHYAANSPVRLKDFDGKDIVVAFSGANLFSESQSATAGEIVKEIRQFAQSEGRTDISSKAVYTDYFDTKNSSRAAFAFILDNYVQGEKIIIYGYSKGGELAMDLAYQLKERNLNVDLLITVDAADGRNSDKVNRTVPSNVKRNENFYQETGEGLTQSRGYPNTKESNGTTVNNHKMRENHQGIDEATKDESVKAILKEVKK